MSIFNGTGTSDLVEAWAGNNKLQEIWVGDQKVWPSGPENNAAFWLDFNDQANLLNNKGSSSSTIPTLQSSGSIVGSKDHAIFGTNGRVFAEPNSTWDEGYTLSMWTRDTPANSGWRTIMHRAFASPNPLSTEAYIVHNTTATTTTTVSGLRIGGTVREYTANYSLPVGADWFHTVVSWERVSSTSFVCRFYINGVPRGTFTATGYPANAAFTTHNLYIGGNRDAGEWSGRMDDLLMWRRAITDAEVQQLYTAGRSSVPQITTESLDMMKNGIAFSQQMSADFSVVTWSAVGLPAGLNINASTGVISGTPTQLSSGTATITASGNGITDQSSFAWVVKSALTSINVPFNSNADIDNFFPIRGFDARTSVSSPKNPAFTFSGMLVAGDNSQNTYWQGLYGEEIRSENVEWVLSTGDVMNTVARPTELILSSDANLQNQLLLQIGSGNLNLVSRTTGAVTSVKALSRTIGVNSNIRVVRNGLTVTVYHNGTSVLTNTGTTSSAMAWFRTAGRAYSGITMFSMSGQWSSRVSHFTMAES